MRTSYKLHKTMEPVTKELNQLESMRLRLLEKHTKDEEVDREAFLAEFNDLLETEVDIGIPTLTVNELEASGVKISPLHIGILVTFGVIVED